MQGVNILGVEFHDFQRQIDAFFDHVVLKITETEVVIAAGVFGQEFDEAFEAAHGIGKIADFLKQAAEVQQDFRLIGAQLQFGNQMFAGIGVLSQFNVAFAQAVMGPRLNDCQNSKRDEKTRRRGHIVLDVDVVRLNNDKPRHDAD